VNGDEVRGTWFFRRDGLWGPVHRTH